MQVGQFQGTRIQLFGLGVIDLIECMRRQLENIAAQAVLQDRLAPQRHGMLSQNDVIAALIDIDHDTDQRRFGLGQTFDQIISRRQLAAGGNQTQMGLSADRTRTHIDMSDESLSCLFVVCGHIMRVHPRTNSSRQTVSPLRLNQTAVGLDDIVTVRTVKTGVGAVRILSDRILRLVAVMRRLVRAGDTVQNTRCTAQVGQRIIHLFKLSAQFCLVGNVLEAAAAALSRNRTSRLDAVMRRDDDAIQSAEGHALIDLDDADVALIADRGIGYENRHSLNPRNTAALGCVVHDLRAVNFVFLYCHGGSPSILCSIRHGCMRFRPFIWSLLQKV